MTAAEINRRVAVEMGARINIIDGGKVVNTWWKWDMRFLGISGVYWKDEPQDYSRDPAAADLVRQEIERRGWEWDTEARWVRGVIGWDACVCIQPSDSGDSIRWKHSVNSPHEALCLAFLAACDAAKEANGG